MKNKAIVLFIIVLFFSFAGCQQNQSSKTSSESQTETLKATSDEATNEDTSYAEHAVTYSYDEATETLTFSGNGVLWFTQLDPTYTALCDIKKPTHVIIPSGFTEIQNYSLSYYTGRNHFNNIETVELPNTLSEIGDESFLCCSGLKTINIPLSVKKIGDNAFEGCSALKEIIIPEGVEEIGRSAFKMCDKLEKIELSSTMHEVSNSLCYSCERLKTLVIADGTKKIGEEAFACCFGLENVSLGKTIEKIGEDAFYNCNNLRSLELPDSLKEISDCAFLCCDKLTSITVPASVDSIGEEAFGYIAEETNHEVDYVKLDGFVIKGYKNTAAEKYAKENGFEFVALD